MIAAIPPVAPIPAVDAAPVAGAVNAANAANAAAAVPVAAPPAPPAPALVDRFTTLMQQIGSGPAGHAHAHGPSQLHRMIDAEDTAARTAFDNIQSLSISNLGNGPEAAASIIQMQNEMAMLSFKLNMVNTMAQSGKSAVQTLMKNQ